ncbi:MAG: cation transporter [Clostridia bacterium]|nr:cation transporter [Clostridia bacterium]
MINFLLKKFVKNYENTTDSSVRENYGAFAGTVGIVVNLILAIAKFLAALVSGFAVSVLADALNNFLDAASSLVTYVGFKLSNKAEDEDHPFGHGRIEYISGLIVSFIIVLVGFELLKESVSKIFNPDANSYSIISVIIMAAAIFIKIWLGFFNKVLGKKINSTALKATALDCFCDVAATCAVLIGLVIGLCFNTNVEGITGTIVSLFIMYTGIVSAKDTLSPLLGEAPDEELVEEIEKTVLAHEEIVGIHDLIVHDYGPGRKILSLHAEVSADGNVIEIHDTIDLIEMELNRKFQCVSTIHMDPIDLNCEVTNSLKLMVKDILLEIDPVLSFHDFRTVSGPTHTNLIFDVVMPFKFNLSEDELKSLIKKKVSLINENYFCVINVDKKYVKERDCEK